jgi:hypothetical protein
MKKLFSLTIATALLSSASAWAASPTPATESRQADVAQRGTSVMPFDLNATTHVFTKTKIGGIQQVVAKRSDDTAQIQLIRQHLQEITQQFAQRDFSGPGHIHGDEMPGLARLKAADPGELQVKYQDTKAGGTIVYETKNPEVLTALHQWFDAQVSDHGHDAMEGHDHATMHH